MYYLEATIYRFHSRQYVQKITLFFLASILREQGIASGENIKIHGYILSSGNKYFDAISQ